MDKFEASATMVALFALRCVAPLAITLGIGYLMNRIVDRWHAQEAIQSTTALEAAAVSSNRFPLPTSPAVTIPCWLLRNCDPAVREKCAAHKLKGIPCWLARLRAEGRLPSRCPTCPIYARVTAAPA